MTDGHPVFVRTELTNTRHIFNFETPLACQPESVDCLVSDSRGNQYDLSPLAKDSGNWEAVDTRTTGSTMSYHINVCRPINKGDPATSSCPGMGRREWGGGGEVGEKCSIWLYFILEECTVRPLVFGRHQFFGTSEHYGKAHGSLLSGWMKYNYTACCWFPTSSNISILPSQFWQIGFESYGLHCSKCRILNQMLSRYSSYILQKKNSH